MFFLPCDEAVTLDFTAAVCCEKLFAPSLASSVLFTLLPVVVLETFPETQIEHLFMIENYHGLVVLRRHS